MLGAFLESSGGGWAHRLVSLVGIGVMVFVAWLLSTNRKEVKWKPVIWGVLLQLSAAFLLLIPELQVFFFKILDGGVKQLLSFAEEGADFVFKSIEPHTVAGPDGTPVIDPDTEEVMNYQGRTSPPVKTFAFWILPSIVFFSSLMSVLYHIGLMQRLIQGIAWIMQRTMGTSGAESLSAAANIFVGQTEAPLVIEPYVDKMTKSELHAVMTGGFATVAGGVMAAYVFFLRDIPGIAGHLVTASILSAPAALAISKVMVPETERSQTADMDATKGSLPESSASNVLEAAANGATLGVKLAINVAAMLIAFVGLVAMLNWGIGLIYEGLSIEVILGWAFAPFAFAMGVPLDEVAIVGQLLGEKIVLTEFIAYGHLGEMLGGEEAVLSQRSAIIATYALCGFANFASIGIQLGGIGGIAPRRMGDLAALGLRAMIGGMLAAFMTATVAGIMLEGSTVVDQMGQQSEQSQESPDPPVED